MDNATWKPNPRPGFRLKKLEVTNWGTFDSQNGNVYSLAPEGRTALLVGQNGSGKSTLVDALLTLLVQPGVRNYNVAAGAKKRERDERTYIRGACGRSSDEDLGSVTDYLRPADKHYSVLLACFSREDSGEAFTIAQVLQILGTGEVEKTYAFADGEKGIASHLSGLTRSERIRKQLTDRGFKATHKYTEYLPWIARVANFRPKAMDVFNQTVAVKDIQSLNRFIRDHMLEAQPWRERIEGLLGHFSQLSQAHQSLVKARRQIELLEPLERAAGTLSKLNIEVATSQQQLDAVDSFFRGQAVAWLQPRLNSNTSAVAEAERLKIELQREIDALDDTQRVLKNEIEKTGGDRLRQLPLLLETQHALLSAKQRERARLYAALKLLDCSNPLHTEADFKELPAELEQLRHQLSVDSSQIAEQRLGLARELSEVRTAIAEEQRQLSALEQQPGNLPSWLADVRKNMTDSLGIPESELQFACELLSVVESELPWQPAIEMVMRRFALSLLVPEKHYRAVSGYINQTALVDSRGRGQRLVYLCVKPVGGSASVEEIAATDRDQIHGDSLVRKLSWQPDHPLAGWLRQELRTRFDYRCCESMAQFQRAPGLALTRQRHVKYGLHQHEKDDRPQALDSRRFVLGWDNAHRLSDLHRSLQKRTETGQRLEQAIAELESESKQISRKLAAVDTALGVPNFDLIDTQRHQRIIADLESERNAIENSNEPVRVLRQRLDAAIERRFAAQRERDAQVAAESNMRRDSDHAAQLLERHQHVLQSRMQDGSLPEHELVFPMLAHRLSNSLKAVQHVSEFSELQSEFSQQIQKRLNQLAREAEPLQADIIRAMQKFLGEHPEERDDLRADLQYIDGFLGLLQQLRHEDLPRHELRFRERLNEKVTQEIGVFHAALQCETQSILSKIEVLNGSLQQLEYRDGTFMRLEPRQVSDREIRDFQILLRDCLSDQFDGDHSADDIRFNRIERLIRRLRDEERWRDKVTDVRRWFDFTARELDAVTGEERSCYEDSSGQSGGEKAKLAFTILVAAIAYQFDLDPTNEEDDRLHFVVVDEMFSKVDDRYAEYALQLFEKFGLQLLIVAPLDAKARVTEPYVGCYLHTVKNEQSQISDVISLTVGEYEQALSQHKEKTRPGGSNSATAAAKPR